MDLFVLMDVKTRTSYQRWSRVETGDKRGVLVEMLLETEENEKEHVLMETGEGDRRRRKMCSDNSKAVDLAIVFRF